MVKHGKTFEGAVGSIYAMRGIEKHAVNGCFSGARYSIVLFTDSYIYFKSIFKKLKLLTFVIFLSSFCHFISITLNRQHSLISSLFLKVFSGYLYRTIILQGTSISKNSVITELFFTLSKIINSLLLQNYITLFQGFSAWVL
jgi:hypothetical protein